MGLSRVEDGISKLLEMIGSFLRDSKRDISAGRELRFCLNLKMEQFIGRIS